MTNQTEANQSTDEPNEIRNQKIKEIMTQENFENTFLINTLKPCLAMVGTTVSTALGSYALGKIIPPEIVAVCTATAATLTTGTLLYLYRNSITPLAEAVHQHKEINSIVLNKEEEIPDLRLKNSRIQRAIMWGGIGLVAVAGTTMGTLQAKIEAVKENTPKPQKSQKAETNQTTPTSFYHTDIPSFS